MLLMGLALGRVWAVPFAAAAWAALLLASGTIDLADAPVAAVLGGANAFAGVVFHRAVRRLFVHHAPRASAA
jgi:predicted transporter